jgi:hypothetical protein
MCRNLGRVGQTAQNKELLIYFFVFSCTLFVFHPYLFLGLDCPEFCLLVVTYNTQTSKPPAGFKPGIPSIDWLQSLALDRLANRIAIFEPRTSRVQFRSVTDWAILFNLTGWRRLSTRSTCVQTSQGLLFVSQVSNYNYCYCFTLLWEAHYLIYLHLCVRYVCKMWRHSCP